MKLVILVISGPVIKELEHTTQPLLRQQSSQHLHFPHLWKKLAAYLVGKEVMCHIYCRRHCKFSQYSIQVNQGNPHLYCHLTYTDLFPLVVEFPCDLIPQEREE